MTPPAPSLTAFDTTCSVPGGNAATATPFAVHSGAPSARTRRAKTSKSPFRSSYHTAIAPPLPSLTTDVTFDENGVMQSGTFVSGSGGHDARAAPGRFDATARISGASVRSVRRAAAGEKRF